ncbi:MAG: NAD(P)-dependent oxidoreductase [Pseudomonadota bacterium]
MDKVTVVGLGAMGLPMAKTLQSAGFSVKGVDPENAALPETTPRVTTASDVFVLSLPNEAVVDAVLADILAVSKDGTLIIDTSTISPDAAQKNHARCANAGARYLDAPVSGGAAGAATGALLIMAGGAEADIAAANPILDALSRKTVHCGGPGAGATVKLANNLLCAGHLLLAGEALSMAEAGGVAPETLLDALNAGSGRSAVSELNLPRWVLSGAFDSGFTLGLMAKDVALAKNAPGAGPLAIDIAERWRLAADTIGPGEDFNRIVIEGKAP